MHENGSVVNPAWENWPAGYDQDLDGFTWELNEPGPSAKDLADAAALFGQHATDYEVVDDLSDLSSGLLMAAGWPRTRAEFELRRLGVMSCRMADMLSRARDIHDVD
jgi:hypothetical protein